MPAKKLLILDFDNTLFDWVALWHRCFTAMMDEVETVCGISLNEIKGEVREVHQRHGTSEYAFLLEDLPSLQRAMGGQPASKRFSTAIDAFRRARRENLFLYPGVADALLRVKGRGSRIAIYTESLSYFSFYRTKRLGLDGVADCIYTPPDHAVPDHLNLDEARHYRESFYNLQYTDHRHTPAGELKPNPDLLLQVISDFGLKPADAVYVGDSLHKDVVMAEDAGVDYAWAAYGQAQDSSAYELLKEVTHWTDKDVEREVQVRSREVTAKITLERRFDEILEAFEFGEYDA